MKNISYAEVLDILSDCSAAIIDGTVTYPYFSDELEEDSVSFHWENEGYDFEANFFARDNAVACVSGSSIFLVDGQGDEVQITILCEKNLD